MDIIYLLKPQLDLNYSLMNALKNRRTRRRIKQELLSSQDISNILWVACGQTQEATKRSKNRRTMPSACNSQKVSICVALESGVYKFKKKEHILVKVNHLDIRNDLVKQPMLKNAPLGLIYIGKKETKSGIIKHSDKMQDLLVGTEVGAMSQNVYLYCASAQLNTVLVGLYDKDKLSLLIDLQDDEEIIYTQVIG